MKQFAGEADRRLGEPGMAGDWLAIRLDLLDDPAVVGISSALGMEPYCVVGRLIRLWSWANRHLQTGVAKGITSNWIDQYVHAKGFAAAMCETGWLQDRSGSIHFPKFDVWNSASAKRRLLKTRQKHKERIESNVAKMSSSNDDKKATRGEERRGEKRKEEVGGTVRPPVFPAEPEPLREVVAEAVKAYQTRRYRVPDPRAKYLPVLTQEVSEVFETQPNLKEALELFKVQCQGKELPRDASFSDIAIACGLKKKKKPKPEAVKAIYKDYTAERLAGQLGKVD